MDEQNEKLDQLNKKIGRLETKIFNNDGNKASWDTQLKELEIERDVLCKKILLEPYYIQQREHSTIYHQVIKMEDDAQSKTPYIISNKIEIDKKNDSQNLDSIFYGYRTEIALFFSENVPCKKVEFLNATQEIMGRTTSLIKTSAKKE